MLTPLLLRWCAAGRSRAPAPPAVTSSPSHPHPTPHFCVELTGLLLSLCPPVVCHMEGSGQWLQDKEAIKCIKAAFHLQRAELLQQQHQLVCRPAVTHTNVYKVGR